MANINSLDWQMWRQLFFRRRYYIIVSLMLTMSGGLYYALTTAPVFESSSTVMIIDADLIPSSSLRFVPRESPIDEIDYFRRRITSEGFLVRLLDSLDVKENPKLAGKINQLSYENPLIDREVIAKQVYVEHLLNRISTRMRAYNLIEINAQGPSSESAYRLASQVTNQAIVESQQSQMQTISAVSDFSSQQLEIYRKRLDDSENRLNSFRQTVTEQGLSEDELSRDKLTEIQSVKLSTDIDLQTKRDQMQKLLSGPLRDISLTYRSQLEQALHDLNLRLLKRTQDVCEMLKKFSWRDVEIILLNEEIGQLKKDMFDRINENITNDLTGQSPQAISAAIRLEEIRAEVGMLQRSSDVLQSIIAGHNQMVRRQPAQDGQRIRLERDVQINREIYEALLQNTRGSQMRESAQVKETKMKFKPISPPQRPLERIKPKRARSMFIAMVLGLGIGLALVMARESFDTTVRSVDDVTRLLKIPVLAAVPKIETNLDITRRKYRLYTAAVAIPLAAVVSAMLIYRIFIR